MAFVNYNNKEITVKIVYYGPALSGKTTCLKYIYASKKFEKKGKLITLDTDGDRTLFFDFLPIEIGKLGDYSIKMQLYTVPGQVSYDTTRKLVLQGADGVVFVADSQVVMGDQNRESFENLKINLSLNNIPYADTPIILQYNKRDLRETSPIDDLNRDLNPDNKPFFPTVATNGENVLEALHAIMKMVIIHLKNRLSIFQKDKTVMFSREEAAAVSRKEPANVRTSHHLDDMSREDTDKEEVVELSQPMSEPEEETDELADADIFQLDDDNILKSEADLEVPEVEIRDELDDLVDDVEPDEPAPPREKAQNTPRVARAATPETPVPIQTKDFDVPIRIEIPEGQGEVKINLNLQIVVKKK